jgi:hypothetical protein
VIKEKMLLLNLTVLMQCMERIQCFLVFTSQTWIKSLILALLIRTLNLRTLSIAAEVGLLKILSQTRLRTYRPSMSLRTAMRWVVMWVLILNNKTLMKLNIILYRRLWLRLRLNLWLLKTIKQSLKNLLELPLPPCTMTCWWMKTTNA